MSDVPPERLPRRLFPHLIVPWHGEELAYRAQGGGARSSTRALTDPAEHVARLTTQLRQAQTEASRIQSESEAELRSDGFAITVEGWSDEPGYGLALDSLGARGASLLSVIPATSEMPERAVVWLTPPAVTWFFRRLDQFAAEPTASGKRKNEKLVANIAELRLAVLRDLWQEQEPFPDPAEERWWELWLARLDPEHEPGRALRVAAQRHGWRVANGTLDFPDRSVGLVRASAVELGSLLSTNAVPSELRRARFAEELFEAGSSFQQDLVADLADRIEPARPSAAAVCLLDTGLMADHPLLAASVDRAHSALLDAGPADRSGHGTKMAGLALFGDLRDDLGGGEKVLLRHRLESVKLLRGDHDPSTDERLYGTVTAAAAALVEAEHLRPRAFSIAVTVPDHDGTDGRPTSWSASLDALAFGTDIQQSDSGVELLGSPDPQAARLFVVCTGNVVNHDWRLAHLDVSDTLAVQDPAHSWNALTVGACTELTEPPANPLFTDWTTVAQAGDLSPFSRTSMTFPGSWPLKPDVVLEGGNLLASPSGRDLDQHDIVSLVTTSNQPHALLTTANATSAATAQAARLAAIAMEHYPSLWPETIRGMLVHAAEWTPAMRVSFDQAATKVQRARLIRRYGWGVPTEEGVLRSASSSVTLIVQDEFLPFHRDRSRVSMRAMRFHQLPWPMEQLQELFAATVRMRVTLSYFIEPNPSNRGWQGRFRYASHGLRFAVKRPTETLEDFQRRLGREAAQEEIGSQAPGGGGSDSRWFLGNRRNVGSLHADIWSGSGADLARSGYIGVTPVGGWWKESKRHDRTAIPIRYALLVSLHTDAVGTDIYTPIATQIGIPIEVIA